MKKKTDIIQILIKLYAYDLIVDMHSLNGFTSAQYSDLITLEDIRDV